MNNQPQPGQPQFQPPQPPPSQYNPPYFPQPQPGQQPPQGYGQIPQVQPPKRPLWKKKRFLIPVGLFVLFTAIGVGSGDETTVASPVASVAPTKAAASDLSCITVADLA